VPYHIIEESKLVLRIERQLDHSLEKPGSLFAGSLVVVGLTADGRATRRLLVKPLL
jgi:hypothetical protein